MARNIHLITVGKLKNSELQKWEQEYLQRLQRFTLSIHEVKSCGDSTLQEAQFVQNKMKELIGEEKAQIILLTERGKLYDSEQFAQKLDNWMTAQAPLFFVIAGAKGPDPQLIRLASNQLSLSPLTFPHQMARLILVEQIYRAHTLLIGHPYHH